MTKDERSVVCSSSPPKLDPGAPEVVGVNLL